MKTPSRRSPAAFSLVELMTVIAIIVILASIVIGSLAYMRERQAKEKAKVQMSLISKALEDYKMDIGSYPGSSIDFGGAEAFDSSGDFSQVLYTALFYEGYEYSEKPSRSDPKGTKATKIYLPELDPRNNKQGWVTPIPNSDAPPVISKLVDPWSNNYLYRVGPNAQNPDFDLWSVGKDGKTNSDPKDKTCRDDIKNF